MTKRSRDILFWVTTSAWLAVVAVDLVAGVPRAVLWFGCGWLSALIVASLITIVERLRNLRVRR